MRARPTPNARTRKAAGERWVTPVAGATITATYGETGPNWSTYHDGVDFAAATGTPIRAVTAGRVTGIGFHPAYGIRTVIRHAPGLETHYCHQSTTAVAKGQEVAAGQVIGAVGETGNTTGPHLHFMVIQDGSDRDPEPYLEGSVDLASSPTDATGAGNNASYGGSSTLDGLGLDAAADDIRRLLLTLALVAGGLGLVALGFARGIQPAIGPAAETAATVIPAGKAAKATKGTRP